MIKRDLTTKIIINLVLSVLIPALIISFSAWYFFGSDYIITANDKESIDEIDLCSGTTQSTCGKGCIWNPKTNQVNRNIVGICTKM